MKYIAVDIGGTQLRAALYPETGIDPVAIKSIPTLGDEPAIVRLLDLIASIWPEDGDVATIGLGVAGPVNPVTGIVYRAPNISNWDMLPIVSLVNKRFNTRTLLGNDANLAALGEWKYGAGIGHHHLIYLTISTGVGGGIICDDRLLVGARGIAAEVGHMTVSPDGQLCGCGHPGHLESYSSGTGIANYVISQIAEGRESLLDKEGIVPTARTVADAARHGDELCIEAFERAGKYLGLAIASLLHLFDPTIVILGGGVTKAGELLMLPVHKSLESSVISPEYLNGLVITTAGLKDQVGLVGALALARS